MATIYSIVYQPEDKKYDGRNHDIVQGLEVERLQPGDQLQIGESAMIEITKARTGCVRLEAAQGRSNEAFGGLVGMMAKVVVGGDIQVGDEVNRA
jgi:MOSC domain-containing protein YiiM